MDAGGGNGAAGRGKQSDSSQLIAETWFSIKLYMVPLIPNTDDLISLLDRVLDKGITMESWATVSLSGIDLRSTNSRIEVASSAVYVGYGTRGTWRDDVELDDLFPFWRREFWSK